MDDELLRFLTFFHYLYPNLNDTFSYATADTERICLDIEEPFGYDEEGYISNGEMLVMVYRAFGRAGIIAFVAQMRGVDPIKPLQTDDYRAARKMLKDWEYEEE